MRKELEIQIIDDDENICFALEELFSLQGWISYSANCVEDGIALYQQRRPDILLMDYHMPGCSGVEGVRRLRMIDQQMPIIVFTVDERQEVADMFLQAGASDFALKPIKAPDIISRIKLHVQLLNRQEKTAAPAREPANFKWTKGLSPYTLQLVIDCMKKSNDYMTVNDVAEGTGLAYQTVYRYMQYLVQENQVEMVAVYGKIGRPKQLYSYCGE